MNATARVGDVLSRKALGDKELRIWISRADGKGEVIILPVNWTAVRTGAPTETNYPLEQGDEVFIHEKPFEAGTRVMVISGPEAILMRVSHLYESLKDGKVELACDWRDAWKKRFGPR